MYKYLIAIFLILPVISKAEVRESLTLSINGHSVVSFNSREFDTLIIDKLSVHDSFMALGNLQESTLLTFATSLSSHIDDIWPNKNPKDVSEVFVRYLNENFVKSEKEKKKVYFINDFPVFSYFNESNSRCREKFIYYSKVMIITISYSSKCDGLQEQIRRLTNIGAYNPELDNFVNIVESNNNTDNVIGALRKNLEEYGIKLITPISLIIKGVSN